MSRKRLLVVGGGLLSLLFLWLALRGQDWREVGTAFRQADYRWLLPATVLVLADYAFRAWRWGLILHPAAGRRLPLSTLFPILLLGFAANNVLPARAGEVWRMWGLAHRTDVRKTMALSTLVVERVFDGFTLLFFLVLAGLIHPLDGQARLVELGTFLLFGGVLVGLLLLLFFEEQTLRIATTFMWPVPEALRKRLLTMLGTFAQGLHALRQPRTLTGIITGSLLAWGSQALSFTMILLAFNLSLSPVQLFSASILMLALINLIIMIPAGPGNVGTFETGGILALTIAGVALTQGDKVAAIVLVTHMLQWLVVTAIGVFIATQEGISLAGLSAGPEMNEG
ncbi:MAG: flippase-like domain-containing protein [Ardenticatenales bacterium]|nr:flippase-like domain-containing protein [Ardenticatenales bacterium]